MDPDEFEILWKESRFAQFEHDADLLNHPLTEEEGKLADIGKERITRWTQEWFDYDDDPDDDGTIDPAEFARLERELANLRLRLEQKDLSEDEYNVIKLPIMEAMYALLKD